MTYKDKTLISMFVLTAFSGWLYDKNYQLNNDPYSESLPLFAVDSGDTPVLFEYTNKEKEELCRRDSSCEKLSETLVYEARSESLQGAYAVASVVLNRVDSKLWPNSIKGVIEQSHQFSYLKDMHKQKRPARTDWERARIIAYNVIYNRIERVTEATHYHTKTISPFWSKKLDRVAMIGDHVFYKGF